MPFDPPPQTAGPPPQGSSNGGEEETTVNPFATGGTTTGGTTTGSSSGGGTSSSEPKVDPVVAQKMNLFQSIYIGLWGEPATEAYLKSAVNSGVNTWEFAAAEREKPAWATTDVYKNKAEELATMLANLGVG